MGPQLQHQLQHRRQTLLLQTSVCGITGAVFASQMCSLKTENVSVNHFRLIVRILNIATTSCANTIVWQYDSGRVKQKNKNKNKDIIKNLVFPSLPSAFHLVQ